MVSNTFLRILGDDEINPWRTKLWSHTNLVPHVGRRCGSKLNSLLLVLGSAHLWGDSSTTGPWQGTISTLPALWRSAEEPQQFPALSCTELWFGRGGWAWLSEATLGQRAQGYGTRQIPLVNGCLAATILNSQQRYLSQC